MPADFTYEEPSATNANLFVGSMMDVAYPKLMIEVTDAAGQTATAAADALLAEFPDMGIERTFGYSLGYEPADMLNGVPGQDLGRVLLVTHNDKMRGLLARSNPPFLLGALLASKSAIVPKPAIQRARICFIL